MTELQFPAPSEPETTCLRCGTCCKKGGPAFHQTDRRLITDGIIPARFLYTIRRGEPAMDPIAGRLVPAPGDIIKIKGKNGSWCCVFFHDAPNNCEIYDDRPLECRLLSCRDPRPIQKVYEIDRLTRKDLVGGVSGLWEAVSNHQERCDYGPVLDEIPHIREQGLQEFSPRLAEIIRYDQTFRRLAVEKTGVDPELLDFIFGRPITETLSGFGISYTTPKEETSCHLKP